jgi:small subunit ribosomal protein S6
MLRYETLLLARTEMSDDDITMIERQLDTIVSDAKGKLDLFDKWGKYKLAYPIKRDTHGIFILARYQVPAEQAAKALKEFDLFLKIKCSESVLRHANVRLQKDTPLTYLKPEPMDISRTGGSLDSFFKENKIENLLSSVDAAQPNNSNNNADDEQE